MMAILFILLMVVVSVIFVCCLGYLFYCWIRKMSVRNLLIKPTKRQTEYIIEVLETFDIAVTEISRVGWVNSNMLRGIGYDINDSVLVVDFQNNPTAKIACVPLGLRVIVTLSYAKYSHDSAQEPILLPITKSLKVRWLLKKKMKEQKNTINQIHHESIDNKLYQMYTESID